MAKIKARFGMFNDNTPIAEKEILLSIGEAINKDEFTVTTKVIEEVKIDKSETDDDWFDDIYIAIEAEVSNIPKDKLDELKEKIKGSFGFEEFTAEEKEWRIVYGMYSETVCADTLQDAVDVLVDKLEADGCVGVVKTISEVEAEGLNEDEYVIAGNHCLALVHNGNFYAEEI